MAGAAEGRLAAYMSNDSTTGPVLVLGATGKTGRSVVAGLRAHGIPIRAASRSAGAASVGGSAGPNTNAEMVRFDWADPRTWDPALAGVDAIYVVTPMEPDFAAESVTALVDRAQAAGVRRLVLLSGLSAEYGSVPMAARELPVRESGLTWTILRPGAFQQNFAAAPYPQAFRAGELHLPLGPDVRSAYIDAADIAEVAVNALICPEHAGRTYHLAGPRALSFPEALDIISHETGLPIRFVEVPEQQWITTMRAASLPPRQLHWSLETFAALRRGEYATPQGDSHRLLHRTPNDFTDFARSAVTSWLPNHRTNDQT